MNVELKPIAESKVRQLGGDVCGVLVRTECSEVMAVSEHGRCTRLYAGVMGPATNAPAIGRDEFQKWLLNEHGLYSRWQEDRNCYADFPAHLAWKAWQAARAQSGQGAEAVGWQFYQDGKWWYGDDRIKDHRKNTREAGFRVRDVYAAPQPAQQGSVPEGWKLVPVEPTPEMREAFFKAQEECEDFEGVYGPVMPDHQYSAMLSVAPQPPQESE